MAIFRHALAYPISTVAKQCIGSVTLKIMILIPMDVVHLKKIHYIKINQGNCIYSEDQTQTKK